MTLVLAILAVLAVVRIALAPNSNDLCNVCGCRRLLHTHLHTRTYCGTCGPSRCSRFARTWPWYRFTAGK